MTFKHSCASTCALSFYFKNIHSMVSKCIKIMTEHEYWLLFPITVTLTLTTKSTHQQRLTTKMRSKLQKLHHRTRPFSVLCALRNFSTSWSLESTGGARAAASCWDFFLVAGDGNHSNHGSKNITMTCRDVVASTKTKDMETSEKKIVKS